MTERQKLLSLAGVSISVSNINYSIFQIASIGVRQKRLSQNMDTSVSHSIETRVRTPDTLGNAELAGALFSVPLGITLLFSGVPP